MPFADTNPALTRLSRAGYALGILSNVDDDLLAETLRHLEVSFALLITAQEVRSYKPAPGHFATARNRIAPRPWLHAAQSYLHDVTPAVAHNIPSG
jgi:2-haloacid dehalogenase/putative hydrolase of the HAD superfamily